MEPRGIDRLEFYFDPLCPWAYQTSLWIREIREVIGFDVAWRFFSLEEINRAEGKKHPWERDWSYGWGLMRVGALIRRESMSGLDRWYSVVGEALHSHGIKSHRPEVAEDLAEKAGFRAGVVSEALGDPSTTDEVRADHDRAVESYGAFGVPTIVFPSGQALFGPKFAPAPKGDAALELWEMTVAWLDFPHLYEIKRPQTRDDMVFIADAFKPYLKARDWQTIERPAPGS